MITSKDAKGEMYGLEIHEIGKYIPQQRHMYLAHYGDNGSTKLCQLTSEQAQLLAHLFYVRDGRFLTDDEERIVPDIPVELLERNARDGKQFCKLKVDAVSAQYDLINDRI